MDWKTTSTLLERLRMDDEQQAWTDFVDHFRGAVVRYAEKEGLDAASAQDVAQNTLMTFVSGLRAGQYEPGRGRLRAWLFGIAHNQVRQHRRGSRRDRLVPVGDLVAMARPAAAAAAREALDDASAARSRHLWQTEWMRSVYERCLERIREHVTRETFGIYRSLVRGQSSPQQLAESLGVSRSVVDNAKSRVQRRLQDCARRFEDA